MTESAWLGELFEQHRAHLRGVAYRMLGSQADADDAVQEAWLRLRRSDTSAVENTAGWLTTVVARICLDMLRSRASGREEPLSATTVDPVDVRDDPEREAILAGSVGLAVQIVLEKLTPAERVAFVLHDMFAIPFKEIAPIVGRTEMATRQLVSRARRRVQSAGEPDAGVGAQRKIVDAFLAAARSGDLASLVALLDPQVELRADAAFVGQLRPESPAALREAAERAATVGGDVVVTGTEAVAGTFAGGARVLRPAQIEGRPGLVFAVGGKPRAAFAFLVRDGRINAIELIGDPARLHGVEF